MSIRKNATKL